MMDHYEELGIDRSAAPDEIRQAYKRLVRLLHPDHCRDEQVRPLADLQMKRLNGVLRTLTNPTERAIYDHATFGGPAPPVLPSPSSHASHISQWYWTAGGAATLLVLIFLVWNIPQPGPRRIATPTESLTASVVPPQKPVILSRSHLPEPKVFAERRESSLPEPVELASPGTPPTDIPAPKEAVNMAVAPFHRVEITPPVVPVLEPVHMPIHPRLSGDWLFVPLPHAKASSLYPPEYIELRVTENAGILRGRYRARYRIPDQAISPAVSFEFEGRAGADRATLPWSGAGGAVGEVRLRLLAPGALEVIWVATRLGRELGLISGTAVLVRKQD